MAVRIILASQSAIRRSLLENAGISCEVQAAHIDEEAAKSAMLAEGRAPSEIAAALAELKAQKISQQHPGALVIGCDQLLEFGGCILSKPDTAKTARAQLATLRGQSHRLLSAAVICQAGQPLWRYVGIVQMQMRAVSEAYLDDYIARNWDSIQHSVGAYKLEEEGVRLFQSISGDHFHVMGLPLLEIISFFISRDGLDI